MRLEMKVNECAGLLAYWTLRDAAASNELRAIASRMAYSPSHRGPDAHGVWIDPKAGVALGHTRFAILHCSSAGAQPMVSSCGRFVLSYNGEVYNAAELRAELDRSKADRFVVVPTPTSYTRASLSWVCDKQLSA